MKVKYYIPACILLMICTYFADQIFTQKISSMIIGNWQISLLDNPARFFIISFTIFGILDNLLTHQKLDFIFKKKKRTNY